MEFFEWLLRVFRLKPREHQRPDDPGNLHVTPQPDRVSSAACSPEHPPSLQEFSKKVSVPRALQTNPGGGQEEAFSFTLLQDFLEKHCGYPKSDIHTADSADPKQPDTAMDQEGPDAPMDHQMPDTLMIMPCLQQSRAGADLDGLFIQTGLDKNAAGHVVVVFFSPKREDDVVKVMSTMQTMGSAYPVRDIIDVYYWGQEIYQCQANADAKKKLVHYLSETERNE